MMDINLKIMRGSHQHCHFDADYRLYINLIHQPHLYFEVLSPVSHDVIRTHETNRSSGASTCRTACILGVVELGPSKRWLYVWQGKNYLEHKHLYLIDLIPLPLWPGSAPINPVGVVFFVVFFLPSVRHSRVEWSRWGVHSTFRRGPAANPPGRTQGGP